MNENQIQLKPEQEEDFKKNVQPIVKYAEWLTIATPEDAIGAQNTLKEIKQKRAMISEKFDVPVKAAHAAWQAAKNLQNFFVNPFDRAEQIIKKKCLEFNDRVEKERKEEEAKAETARREAERKQKDKLDKEAEEAKKKGRPEKAEALQAQKESVFVPPVFTPAPAPVKAAGVAFKSVWKGQAVDMMAVCKSIVEGKAPIHLIKIDQSELNTLAKSNRNTMPIPGLRFFEEKDMSVRA